MKQKPFGLIGFACDEGVRRNNGRQGASGGPAAFRSVLKQTPFVDYGDVHCRNGELEAAQAELGNRVFEIYQADQMPVVIGGGHETAWGTFQGIQKHLDASLRWHDKPIGIINLDAHFDLRPLIDGKLGSSGTPFTQIANAMGSAFDYLALGIQPTSNADFLFETARDLHAYHVLAERFDSDAMSHVNAMLERHEHIYLSICLDVFASAYAPGVSAPQPFGLTPTQVLPVLRELAQSGKVIAIDIVELAPNYDPSGITARLAASLLNEWIRVSNTAT